MINKEIGTALYTGIMTDTASFRFPKTSPTTHRVVATLIETGLITQKFITIFMITIVLKN